MSDALLQLEVPESASLVESTATPSEAVSWREFIAAEDRPGAPSDGRRRVVGVRGANGGLTIRTILSLIRNGFVPAPFPPSTANNTYSQCLERLEACAEWTDATGWRNLPGERPAPTGFDLIMHSSGSTGLPKPIAIRLAAMRDNARDVASALALSALDIHLGTMSHCYMSGLFNATILPLVTGGRAVLGPLVEPATLDQFLTAIERHRPTVLWLNPFVAQMIARLRGVGREALRGVGFAVSCTAPLPAAVKAAFEERFAIPLLQSYGLCEALITTVEHPGASAPATVGKPVGPRDAVAVDSDGRVVIRNRGLCAGYLHPWPTGPQVLPLTAFETEDLGRFDYAGNLVITGRVSETIHRHGVKFSPERIERVLLEEHGVTECAVVNYRSADRDIIVAWVSSAESDSAALFDLLRHRLPAAERPDMIGFTQDFPRTPSGKIDRRRLREREPNALHRP